MTKDTEETEKFVDVAGYKLPLGSIHPRSEDYIGDAQREMVLREVFSQADHCDGALALSQDEGTALLDLYRSAAFLLEEAISLLRETDDFTRGSDTGDQIDAFLRKVGRSV